MARAPVKTIRIKHEAHDKLQIIADNEGRSKKNMVEKLIADKHRKFTNSNATQS